MLIRPSRNIDKTIKIPGDKSISHRAIMLSSIAEGESKIYNFLMGDDCLNTIKSFQQMGVDIEITDNVITVQGVGLKGLKKPKERLDVGNSGTTIRLLSGILVGQDFQCEITGDESIQSRPMGRIITPLKKMGANIQGKRDVNYAPLKIQPGKLNSINYNMPVASAQVKSAILLASLYTDGKTNIIEPKKSRDHTERMLNYMGGNIKIDNLSITSSPVEKLHGREIYVPGDISSAAFFLVLGAIAKDSEITIEDVGMNPTRTGIIHVLEKMGANIQILNERNVNGEPMADIYITSSELKGIEIGGEIIPTLIDEIPIIAVAASLAKGRTVIRDAEELKVKECDRIHAMVNNLNKIGAHVDETPDGMIIYGKNTLKGGSIKSYNDHRIAMALAIAGIVSEEGVEIDNPKCVDISFPGFFHILNRMMENEK